MSNDRKESRHEPLPRWFYPTVLVANLIAIPIVVWATLRHTDGATGGLLLFGLVAGVLASAALFIRRLKMFWLIFLLYSASTLSYFACYCRNASSSFAELAEQITIRGPENPFLYTFLFLIAIYCAGFVTRPRVQQDLGLEVQEFDGIQ